MKCAAAHFIYLHLSQRHLHAAASPLDSLPLEGHSPQEE
jgi:hypothetical protein